ncbi:hypothetical protein niasHT_001233 [Heterodera trifolii]|uniref:Homeobox domain-containing protein n=1 Tax=Heterodera trifolii TaxID=157864 RepID=A0ABD2M696_9BILA
MSHSDKKCYHSLHRNGGGPPAKTTANFGVFMEQKWHGDDTSLMDGACAVQSMDGATVITTDELGYCKRKKKRFRTSFSAWQLAALEAQFRVQQYLVGEQRAHFAEQLGLGPTQVKVWFQNRRIRFRKHQRTAKAQKCTVTELPKAAKGGKESDEITNNTRSNV